MGARPRRGRGRRRGRARRVGRSTERRGGRASSGSPCQRHPRLQAAHRARARAPVRSRRPVVPGLGSRARNAGGMRRARHGRRPASCDPPGVLPADCGTRRGDRRRHVGLRHSARAARLPAGEGRRPLSRGGRGEHPRQGVARSDHARRGRALPRVVVRHQQGLPLPGPLGGAAGVGSLHDPPAHRGCSWTTTCRGQASAAPAATSHRRCSSCCVPRPRRHGGSCSRAGARSLARSRRQSKTECNGVACRCAGVLCLAPSEFQPEPAPARPRTTGGHRP